DWHTVAEHLERLEHGLVFDGESFAPTSSPAMAARVIQRLERPFHDEQGRVRGHYPRGYNPRMLLHWLCQPYRVDQSVGACLSEAFGRSEIHGFYAAFYRGTEYLAWLRDTPEVALVGISASMAPQLGPSLILARCIRELRPDVRIVLGGSTFSLMAAADLARVLEVAPVDAIVRFEGERPLLALCEQVARRQWAPAEVPGVASRVEGRVQINPAQAGVALEELAFPHYDAGILARLADPILSVVQARGCYWGRCAYCDYVELYEGNPRYRTRSVERFVDEMEHQIATHGIRRFTYVTEALPPAFARKSGLRILERGLDVRWGSFVMVERHFGEETFAIMRESGCERIVVGVETMTDRVLKVVRKASTEAEISAFLRLARDNGITVHMNIIMDLPTTTFADAMQSLASFRAHAVCVADINLFRFEATRSAEVGRTPERFGLRVISSGCGSEAVESWHSEYPSNHLHVVDPAMTPQEREEVYRRYEAFVHDFYGAKFLQSDHAARFMLDARDRTTPVRIAMDHVDVLEDGDDLHCFQWQRGLELVLRGAHRALWDMVVMSVALTGDELVARFDDPQQGEAAWVALVDGCALVRAPRADDWLLGLLGVAGEPEVAAPIGPE
ncbi:MAG: radical SAM protein, partial [Myxococcales bacterium]|nr:radical SAM protein [Myxococcales bacterium]